MLNAIIRFSLRHRLLVAALAAFLLAYGAVFLLGYGTVFPLGYATWERLSLPIDVFPDLNRPRVTIITEAPGMAPEEVETLITFPMETALNGATGVQAVRSSSGVGISIVWVEFDWGTDVLDDRQIVNERLALIADRLPPGIKPQLAPISSIMGQIMIIGMQSKSGKTSPMQLRTLADWSVRQRLLTIPGVSQVFTIGGDRKQFQVLVDPQKLLDYGVALKEVRVAVERSNANVTGGYLDDQGAEELLVRSLGRVRSVEDLQKLPVKVRNGHPILLDQVARIIEGPQVKRGDSAAFVRGAEGQFGSRPAVLLTVNKQPGADTRKVTQDVLEALRDLEKTLSDDIQIHPQLYQQKAFIDLAVDNVKDALWHGFLLVVVILFIFLLNFRTTFITLTAIPLSVVITALVFRFFGLSINTMTLGGLAVAVGELVDDAIVGVENVFRRLRENRLRKDPRPALLVVFRASAEVRNPIVFGTLIVVLFFLPVFAFSGMEGRLFAPLGAAYIVSILSSLLVALTLTPVLSYWLLACKRIWPWLAGVTALLLSVVLSRWLLPEALAYLHLPAASTWLRQAPFWAQAAISAVAAPVLWLVIVRADRSGECERESIVLQALKKLGGWGIGLSLRAPNLVLLVALLAVAVSCVVFVRLERDFLPPFDEGVVQLNVILPPGTSLEKSKQAARRVEQRLQRIDGLQSFVSKTGRAELDEHAVGVNVTEIIANFRTESGRSREQVLEEIRDQMAKTNQGVVTTVEQPMAHLISHMLSGVQAQVAIKVYGKDLGVLHAAARKMKEAIKNIDGVTDLRLDPKIIIPQLRIELDRDRLAFYGLTPGDVNEFVETAMHGKVVSQVLIEQQAEQQTFDLLVRLDEPHREDLEALKRLRLELPDGGSTSLGSVARIERSSGPNTINREQVCRRIVLQCNVAGGHGLVDVVEGIQAAVKPIQDDLPAGYFVEFGGQFERQQSASKTIFILLVVLAVGVFLVLYTMFRSANFALQVMAAVLMALIGAVAALVLTGQTLTIAAWVGIISLGGIASRNGILLLNHYLHLVRNEGETFSPQMLIRAGQERLSPVLMTALTSGIGLVPLALAAGEPGKEILYPIATVIIGGLLSSTLLEFLVRPALFWTFGRKAGQRLVEGNGSDAMLEPE